MAEPIPSIFNMSTSEMQGYISLWAGNFQRNIVKTFDSMTPQKYIRIIAMVGAYALLRPYIMKLGSRFQTREHEKEVDAGEMAAAAKISPNSLRGQVEVPEDSEDEEGEAEASGASWGKKARRRQRQMVRKLLEAEEKLRREEQEDEEDKDIEEFLVR